ncbi:acyl carrier protein phosphodiesterase [Stutzerimonas tarimensis]|uniref:ACP phosphodiesterase n=1 Tax=Stutzerimonas tarimensis TaxID=1507735 RepID=A0ABV7T279_9GAMM
MNYLAHLHLAGPEPDAQLGGLYGDFVKGPLRGAWPAPIERGIRLHRRIDAFTDTHSLVLHARSRFPGARRRYAGILIDLFFDHCLARDWAEYADEPLGTFTSRMYRLLLAQPALPGKLADIAPRMARHDWLGSYRDFKVLEQVLANMSRRLSRPEALIAGMADLERLYLPLSEDFRQFYPALMSHAREVESSASSA